MVHLEGINMCDNRLTDEALDVVIHAANGMPRLACVARRALLV